ncbi:MAG: GPW/gp25 family protein [Bacteroidia bacterium]
MNDTFLGTGWSFPPTFDAQARKVKMVAAEEDVKESLQILLGTAQGERVMRPGYGADLGQHQFEGLSTSFVTLLKKRLETAIIIHEPRIDLLDLQIVKSPDNEGVILLEIDYQIRSTNTRYNLVYPYYLNEATDASI